jgi:hypothetical protein
MSSPRALVHAVCSAELLLALDEDQFAEFLDDCRTLCNEFDFSRVAGVDGLSEGQRTELRDKLK